MNSLSLAIENSNTTPASAEPPEDDSTPSTLSQGGFDCYVGDFAVDLDAVKAANTPSAVGGYQPVPHLDLYRRVQVELDWAGIELTEELHALYRGGDRYIGLGVTNLQAPQGDAEVIVGWFNSHDKSHAATLLLGERVMVCFNLCLHAEIKVTRRHTKHIRRDLPGLVASAVDKVRNRVDHHARRMDIYRARPLQERDAHHLVVRLVQEGSLTPSSLKPVLKEWREPSYPEFAERWDVNRLYQAVTNRTVPLSQMAYRHRALHGVLDDFCGVSA